MIGLDCTLFGRISDETKDKIKLLGKAGNMLASIIERDIDHDETGTAIHDLQTIFYLLHPEKFTAKKFWVDVVCEGPAIGATVADIRKAYHDKTNVKVCLDVDTDAFNKWFLEEVEKNMQ